MYTFLLSIHYDAACLLTTLPCQVTLEPAREQAYRGAAPAPLDDETNGLDDSDAAACPMEGQQVADIIWVACGKHVDMRSDSLFGSLLKACPVRTLFMHRNTF